MTVSANPNNVVSAELDFALGQPGTVQVTAVSGGHVVDVPPTATASTSPTIPLLGLRSERTYDITATVTPQDPDASSTFRLTGSFQTGPIPERFVPYTFESDPERSAPGYTIIEMQGIRDPSTLSPARPFDANQYLIAIDADGEIVWYYENGPVIAGVEQTPDGNFTALTWPNGVRAFDALGNTVGEWFAPLPEPPTADSTEVGNATTTTSPPDPSPAPARTVEAVAINSDLPITLTHHEAIEIETGNYLTLSTAVHELTADQRGRFCPDDTEEFDVFSDVAIEFDADGNVVRSWDLWDVIDVDETPGEEMCTAVFAVDGARDWTHANAVVYDPERDAVIFSARHTSQVIAMTRGDDVGAQTELLWVFGEDGTMPIEGDAPRYQHAVEVQPDGSILLYDNGNGRDGTGVTDANNPTYSRAVLYEVDDSAADPTEWTVTQRWEHRMDDVDGQALFAPIIGDADRLSNGNVLITHGSIDFFAPDSYSHATIVEVVPNLDSDPATGGDIVWRLDAGEPGSNVSVYRAERIDSFYVGPDWAQ